MIVVARRRYVDQLRRSRRETPQSEVDVVSDWVEEPDWAGFEGGVALRCLGRLRDDQRAALVFRYVDDLSVRKVAELMQRSESATESLLARGRRELARLVEETRHG